MTVETFQAKGMESIKIKARTFLIFSEITAARRHIENKSFKI